jgi:hypothetical protein
MKVVSSVVAGDKTDSFVEAYEADDCKPLVAGGPVTVIPRPQPAPTDGADAELMAALLGDQPSGISPSTTVATILEGVERAVAARANVDNLKAMHRLVANSGNSISEEKVLALLPHLVRLGGNVNHADESGNTPLHVVAGIGASPSIIKKLLSLGRAVHVESP